MNSNQGGYSGAELIRQTTFGLTCASYRTGIAAVAAVFFAAFGAIAQPDPGSVIFLTTPTNITFISAFRVLPDGRMFVWTSSLAGDVCIRMNAEGQELDRIQASVNPEHSVYDATVQVDGKILMCGDFESVSGVAQSKLARLNVDGSVDTNFRPRFESDEAVDNIGVQPDGKILILVYSDWDYSRTLYRLKPDGSMDPGFKAADVDAFSLDVLACAGTNGPIVMAGQLTRVNGQSRFGVALLEADGSLNSTFVPDKAQSKGSSYPILESAAVLPDGRVLISGEFDHVGSASRTNVAILQKDGHLDTSFNAGPIEAPIWGVRQAMAESSGKIMVLGDFTQMGGQPRNGLARLLTDGRVDTSYIVGMSNWFSIEGAVLLPDDTLAISGYANPPGGSSFEWVGRLAGGEAKVDLPHLIQNPTSTHTRQGRDVALGINGTSVSQLSYQWYFNGSPISGETNANLSLLNVQQAQSGAYFATVANSSGSVTGEPAVVLVDATPVGPGGGDSTFYPGAGADDEILAMVVQPDGKILIGGRFKKFDGVSRRGIARLNADGSLDSSFASSGCDGYVRALLLQPDGKLVVGGSFSQFNGGIRPNLVRLNGDGSIDSTFRIGSGPSAVVYALASQPDGRILVGGSFKAFSGIAAQSLARLSTDGVLDVSFSNIVALNGLVDAIAVLNDGKIYIGGGFDQACGATRMCLARLLPDGNVDYDFNPGWGIGPSYSSDPFRYPSELVRTIVPLENGQVLVEGGFSRANDEQRLGIVKLTATGEVVPGFFVGIGNLDQGFTYAGTGVALMADGRILVGIDLNSDVNAQMRSLIACLNSDGSLNPSPAGPWPSGPTGRVNALGLLPNGSAVVAGSFTAADGLVRNRIARYSLTKNDEKAAPVFPYPSYSFPGGFYNIALPATNRVPFGTLAGGFSIQAGQDIVLAAPVTSFEPVQFQWVIGGRGVAGATNAVYQLPNVRSWSGEPVHVLARNSAGTTASPSVTPSVMKTVPKAGHVDTSFAGPSPINGKVAALALQSDGKIIIAGSLASVGGVWSPLVARLKADGALDSFKPGWSHATGIVNRVVAQTDGRILLGGTFVAQAVSDGRVDKKLVRLMSDGARDLQFDPQLNENGWVEAIAPRADGSMAVGGVFDEINQTPQRNIALLQADGTLATNFLAAANGTVYDLVWQPDGKLLMVGCFTEVNGVSQRLLSRLNPDGSVDTSFKADWGANDAVLSVCVQPDGKILVAGAFTDLDNYWMSGLGRLNPDGSLDLDFYPDVESTTAIQDVLVQPDGKVLVTGDITAVEGLTQWGIARLNADGSLDDKFESDIELTHLRSGGTGLELALQPDGNILVGGYFNAAGGTHRARVARLYGAQPAPGSLSPMPIALNQTVRAGGSVLFPAEIQSEWPLLFQWYKGAVLPTNAIPAGTNQTLRLSNVSSNDTGRYVQVAQVAGSASSAVTNQTVTLTVHAATDKAGLPDRGSFVGTGANGVVRAMLRGAEGQIVIGGDFTQVNGAKRNGLAHLKADGSVGESFDLSAQFQGRTFALAFDSQSDLLVGGDFTLSDATVANALRVRADGTLDSRFRVQVDTHGLVRAILGASDGSIYVGGVFQQLNGAPCPNLARLNPDGSKHLSFAIGAGPDGPIEAVAQDSKGSIWVGGRFTHFNGQACPGFMRLLPSGEIDSAFQAPSDWAGWVHAIAVRPDGRMTLGGRFTRGQTAPALALCEIDAFGALNLAPGPIELLTPEDEVFALAAQPDNQLIVAGSFSGLHMGDDALARHGIARIAADGTFDRTFDPDAGVEGFGAEAVVLCMQLEPDGNLLIGGGFTLINGLERNGIARIIGTNLPVSEIRRPPTFHNPIIWGAYTTEGTELVLTNLVADAPDANPGSLIYSLDPGAPQGMKIDAKTGRLTWSPTEAQGPAAYSITVRVSDDGVPPLEATKTFSVSVSETKSPPNLDVVPVTHATVNQPLTIQLAATDPDLPASPLQFWLGPGAPEGCTLDALTGVLSWTPTSEQLGTNTFEVVVSDDSSPPGIATRQVVVTVTTPPSAGPELVAELDNEKLTIQIYGGNGRRYQLEASQDLNHWEAVWVFAVDEGMNINPISVDLSGSFQFYRIRQL